MHLKLNPELAERFIKQITMYTKYNVNIINEKGYIIAASRNPERIGTFHEAAYQMIQERQDMMLINDESDYLGVKKGVNLLLSDEKEPMGVVGVTGEPEKVHDIALVIKMALETMITYEIQQFANFNQRSKQEQLYMALLEENPISREKLEILAKQLELNDECIRISIVLCLPERKDAESMISILRKKFLTVQDICYSQSDQHILIYKKLEGSPEKIFLAWRYTVLEWLEKITSEIPYNRAYIGSMQCRLHYYRKAFEHCKWLEKNISSGNREIFFSDYVDHYLSSLIPSMELHAIYNTYDRYLEDDFKNMYISTIGVLLENNYNLVSSSQKLFVHKNTLSFRLNKIKNSFNVNPFQSATDRTFLNGLYLYLHQKKTSEI